MSLSVSAIRQAITDVLEASSGSVRVLSSGVYSSGVHAGQTDLQQRSRALTRATHTFDVKLDNWRSNGATPVGAIGANALERVDIEIAITTHTSSVVQDTARAEVLHAIMSDANDAMQALNYPGNLATDSLGNPTGIVSGMMLGPDGSTRPTWSQLEQDWGKNLIRSAIRGTAIVQAQQDIVTNMAMNELFGSNLRLWHRGSNGVSADVDGMVSQWDDLTPLGHESLQILSDRRPTRTTGGQGGRAYISVGNTPRAYMTGSHDYVASSTPISTYVVGRFRSVLLGSSLTAFAFTRASGALAWSLGHSSAGVLSTHNANSTIDADTDVHLFAMTHDGASTLSLSVDNGTPYTVSAALVASPITGFTLGSTSLGGVAPFDFYELLALNTTPTADQHAAVIEYVNARYGLEVPL